MIKLIVGRKGSGKTKILLDMVKEGVKNTDGNVVFIDNSDQHTFELDHSVRRSSASSAAITTSSVKCSARSTRSPKR